MSGERFVGWAVVLMLLVVIGGLVARRRVGSCRTFVPYLLVIAVADLLMLLWPEQFHRQWFWFGKELLIDFLRFALALELTYRTFRAFPSAQATARGLLLAVLLVTLAVVFAGTGSLEPREGAPTLGPLISDVQPRVLNGSIWLLTAIAGLILWYRLPVHPLHKAILVGLVPYLLIFSVCLNLIGSLGWGAARAQLNYLYTVAQLLVLVFWAWVAWRPSEAPVQAVAPATSPTTDQVAG